jgi:hypothetical protein
MEQRRAQERAEAEHERQQHPAGRPWDEEGLRSDAGSDLLDPQQDHEQEDPWRPFDAGSAAGRMMLQMLGVFAEFEHATIVDRVTSGIERRAREGRWPNGRIPFGYARNENKELIPDERTAPVIKRVFTWYAAGRMGAAAIARRLDDEHAPAPPRGWQPAIVLWILANEAYVGRVHLARPNIPRPARATDRPGHLRPRAKRC